jgi:phospholipid transport system substrate-binding protein
MSAKRVVGKLFSSLLLMLSFFPMASMAQSGGNPLQLIESGTDQALQILRAAQTGHGPTLRQRKEEILDIVDDYFDFEEMGKRALGRPWKDQAPAKQKEFVALFKRLLFNTYVDRVETYTGSNEQVVYDQEQIEGNYGVVYTRILGYKNRDIQVDYRLRQGNKDWKVYDVIVEGISLVNNYRQQFNSILANDSFDSLLELLKDKVAVQEKE